MHGHDLGLEPHLHSVKWQLLCPRLLVLQIGQARVRPQPGEYGVYVNRCTGDGAIDTLRRQQQRALDCVFLTLGQQWRLPLREIGQFDKLVQGGGQVAGHGFGRLEMATVQGLIVVAANTAPLVADARPLQRVDPRQVRAVQQCELLGEQLAATAVLQALILPGRSRA